MPTKRERVLANVEEVVTEDELDALLEEEQPTAYIGFEPSGTAHLGWLICARKVRDLQEAGFDVTILLADWHAQINDKLGGELDRIQACGIYMEEAMKALGVREDVRFTYASEWVGDADYWAMVLRVAKASTLNRIKRAMSIMGREAGEAELDYGKTIYPAMQVADIYYGGFDLALGGMDQRHAHMLARDVASKLDREPPVALHTPLLPSLKAEGGRMDPATVRDSVSGSMKFGAGAHPNLIRQNLETAGFSDQDIERVLEAYDPDSDRSLHQQVPWLGSQIEWGEKMSKSDPTSGIFLHDTPEEVEEKVKGAYCPQGELEGNPLLELLRLVVFPGLADDEAFVVDRPEKFGGPLTFGSYDELAEAFADGLHPLDLKNATAAAVNAQLDEVRAYFNEHPKGLEALQEALSGS